MYTTECLCLGKCFLWRKSRWPHYWINCYLETCGCAPSASFWHGIMMVIKELYVVCICRDVCCHFGRRRNKPGKINILIKETVTRTGLLSKGCPHFKKCSFFEHCSKGLWPPPFYLNSCPILQGVFFKTRFCREWKFDIMYLLHPQISPSMPQKPLFMQISCC